MSKKKSPFQIGQFWLETDTKSPNYYYAWYSKRAGRIKRKSTNCKDFELAKEWLLNHYLMHDRSEEITDPRKVLENYWLDHGYEQSAHAAIRSAISSFTAFLDTEANTTTIDDINPRLINRFIKWRRTHTIKTTNDEIKAISGNTSPNTIQTNIKYIRAAFHWAYKNDDIKKVPTIPGLKKEQLNGPRRSFISMDMMVKALEYAQDCPHLFNFILASIGTIARPETVLDIHTNNIDPVTGYLDLNPKGRNYTSKHRPIVALPDFMMSWINEGEGFLINYRGNKVTKISKSWRSMREKLDWDNKIVAKTIRHSINRTFRNDALFKRRNGLVIDPWELSGHMGHRGHGDLETTEEYAQYEPNENSSIIQGLNAYYNELQERANFSLHPKNTRKKIRPQKAAKSN